jgi:hypothetical protein
LTWEFEAARGRSQDDMVQATAIAYQTVRCWAITRTKKRMPTFESLLPKTEPSRPMNSRQLSSVLRTLSAQYGGRVVKAARARKAGPYGG